MYTDDKVRGGTTQILATFIGALSSRFEVVVLGVDEQIVEEIAAHRPDTETAVVPLVRNKWHLSAIVAHIRVMRRLRPDILHANLRYPWAAQYGVLAAALTPKVRIVAVENSPIPPANTLQRWLRQLLVRQYDAYVGVGVRVARWAEELLRLEQGSVRTIYNGVPAIRPTAPVARASEGPVVGVVARLAPEKGLDVLLQALVDLPGVTAVMVGDGPDREQLQADAEALGIADRVVFTGWQREPANYLGSFDVFVLPSRHEAFGLAALEAMSVGLPVVATRVGSVDELVLDGETGIIVPPEDPHALAEAIRRLLADPDLRRRLGERGRQRAAESFTAEAMARQFESLYDELLR